MYESGLLSPSVMFHNVQVMDNRHHAARCMYYAVLLARLLYHVTTPTCHAAYEMYSVYSAYCIYSISIVCSAYCIMNKNAFGIMHGSALHV